MASSSACGKLVLHQCHCQFCATRGRVQTYFTCQRVVLWLSDMATTAAARDPDELARSKKIQDLYEAVGEGSKYFAFNELSTIWGMWRPNFTAVEKFLFIICLVACLVLLLTISVIVHTVCGAAFLSARRSRTLLPFVVKEESESFTEYQRPLYNVHFIAPSTPAAGKRPSWRGPRWLKDLYSYLFTKFKFNKGHLVPRANMVSREDQEMTMELADNVVPIDMAVNGGNMEAVERSLRNLADKEGELVEYTGWLGELYLCSVEDAIVEIEKFVRDRGETTTIEEIKKYFASCNGRIWAPKYLYKMVLRKDTYEFVGCTVISNDVNQAPDDPTLPKGGLKPKGMKNVAWNDPKKGLTRYLLEEEYYKWSKENYPDDSTPKKCIKDARKDKSREAKRLTFDTMSPVNFEKYIFPMPEKKTL